MTQNDIGKYKKEIISTLVENEDIAKLILGNKYNKETASEDLLYEHIFPYLYVDDVQEHTDSYICVEIDVPRTMGATFKQMNVIVWCYCHKDIMKYSKKGYSGTRADILTTMVDDLLNTSREFGVGRLMLTSNNYMKPHTNYYGRALVYSCPEFNVDKKL